MNLRVKHPTLTSSNVSWKSGDRASDQFPAGLRVLVVDDDHTCLRILEKMLKICLYEVTTSNRAELALEFLRDNKNGYDIVISDVHMPDMDGFKLLEHVGLEMDLPVIMMSADDSKNVVMKGITHGACDYLIKPVRIEALKNIWQHVVRKKKHEWNEKDFEQSDSLDEQQKPTEDVDYSSSVNEGNWKSSKRRKEEEDEADERDDTSTLKKPRVVWSVELHQQFVTAVNQLGIDKAVPKKILELMNVPGLTRENVASHLQKYRLYLRRLSHQNGLSNSFMGPVDPPFGPISSLSRFDLQALAASGQLPPESLATIQAAVLGRGTPRPSIPPLLVDQRNIFGYENKKSKYIEGQQQQQQNDIGKQANFLHGIPTSLDSQQLATLRQSGLGGMSMSQSNSLLIQIGQPQPILNEINRGQVSNIPSSVCQPVGGPQYTSISQPSRALDFSSNGAKFSSNNFSLVGNSGPSSLPYKLQDEANSEIGASRGFLPNYDAFDDLNRLQNIGFTLEPLQHSNVQGGLDVSCGQNRVPSVNKGLGNTTGIGQQLNSSVSDSPLRIKAERFPDIGFQNSLFPQRFGQEDLISAILKQQQQGTGPVENEFGFDGYQLDNLPV